MQHIKSFLESVLPPLPPQENLFSQPAYFSLGIDKRTGSRRQEACLSIDSILDNGQRLSAMGYNAYFALASFADGLYGRKQANARLLKSFWVDLDVGKAANSYPTIELAVRSLSEMIHASGLRPSYINFSGAGLHVFWALDTPIPVEKWRRVAVVLERFCTAFGLIADPACTKDPARVLRIPGTLHQTTGQTVTIMRDSGIRWSPHNFAETMLTALASAHPDVLMQLQGATRPAPTMPIIPAAPVIGSPASSGNALLDGGSFGLTDDSPYAKAEPICQGCRQMITAGLGAEPQWYAAMSVFRRCVDGREWAHAVSALDSARYVPSDTEAKFWHAPENSPARCDRFDAVNPGVCPKCQYWGKITSPVQIYRRATSAGEVYTVPTPQPAAVAPAPVAAPMPQTRLQIPETFYHPRIGFSSKRFSVDDRGCIWHRSEKQDDGSWVTTDHIITTSQIYYVKSEWTYDNGISERSHWFEVKHRHGAVEMMRLPASTIASNQSLMAALNSSNVLSCNLDQYTPKLFASFMNAYLRSVLESGNMSELQTKDTFGWTDVTDPVTKTTTRGFGVGHGVITETGMHDTVYRNSAEKLAQKELTIAGNLDAWKDVPRMYRVLNQPAAQLAICLSFAAPLMSYGPGVVRSAAYSLWSPLSGKGKSQVLCAAASVWGHPENQFIQRNSSAVMRMRKMAVMNNLPVFMDELSDAKDEDLYALAYSLMGNQEKQKLKSNGAEMVDTGSWSTVTFITANKCIKEAVARHAGDSEASIVRVMEYECDFPSYADVPEVQEYIHACMGACKANYGMAGPEFIYQVLQHRDRLCTLTQQVEAWCSSHGFDNSERFLSYPLALAMKAGRWAVEFGLLDYDMDALERWVMDVFVPHNRASTRVHSSDVRHLLSTYLMERQLNMLVTRQDKRTADTPEVPHGMPDKFIIQLPTNRDVLLRASLESKELYISRADLHKWLRTQKHSPTNLWKRLAEQGIYAMDTTTNFSDGIGWLQTPTTRCYKLDAASVDKLGFVIQEPPATKEATNIRVL